MRKRHEYGQLQSQTSRRSSARRHAKFMMMAAAGIVAVACIGGAWGQAATVKVPEGKDSSVPAAMSEGAKDLAARIAKAPKLDIENIGTPIRGTQGGGIEWVPNPDGKTYDLLIHYYKGYVGPHTTVYIDLGTGELKKDQYGWRGGINAGGDNCMGPDGKLYHVGAVEGGMGFRVYDPAKNEVHKLEGVLKNVQGEARRLTLGTDGKLYGSGSYNGRAVIYRFDPLTGKIDNYGQVGPSHAPAACWGYAVAADDTHVYVTSGKVPWYLVAYDRQTGKDDVIFKESRPKGAIHLCQERYGCLAIVRGGEDKDWPYGKPYWLYQGKMIAKRNEKDPPPWPEPKEVKPSIPNPPKPEIAGEILPKTDGKVTLWYRTPEAREKASKNPADDAIPETLGWKAIRYEVPTYGYLIHSLIDLPDGRVMGAGDAYMGNFIYDPKTGVATHLGILHLSQNSGTVADGKVFMSGYPSSGLYVYDPDRPWTANESPKPWLKPVEESQKESNPCRVTYLANAGSGCHAMLAAVSARDKKVYFGGRWMRDGEGGGLGWWDSRESDEKKAAGGIDLPFRNYQVHYMTTAADGRYVVISTKAARDQIDGKPEPEQAKLFIFDTTAGKIVRELEPVKKAKMTGPVAGVGGSRVLGITCNPRERDIPGYTNSPGLSFGHLDKTSLLYLVDVETGTVLWTRTLPYPAGFRMNGNARGKDGFAFRLGPDGKVWTYTGGKFMPSNPEKDWHYSYLGPDLALIRIDPKDGTIEVVGKVDRPGEIAFSGKDIILSGGCKYLEKDNVWLRRIRNVMPAK